LNFTKLIIITAFLFQASCATIVKSERTMVTFNGGLSNGVTKIDIPDGQYTTNTGNTTVLVSRSRQDIPITVTCNDQSRNGIIRTSYDPLAGFVGSLLLGGIIGIGVDALGNKAYDPPSAYNLSGLCYNEGGQQGLAQQNYEQPAKKSRRSTASQ
jgi:hypothetical protein